MDSACYACMAGWYLALGERRHGFFWEPGVLGSLVDGNSVYGRHKNLGLLLLYEAKTGVYGNFHMSFYTEV